MAMPPAGSAGVKDLYPLVGVVPIVNTPFTEKDTIDYASVERLIDQACARRCERVHRAGGGQRGGQALRRRAHDVCRGGYSRRR